MPLKEAAAICQATRLLAAQCKQKLAKLRGACIEVEACIEAARDRLEEAERMPPAQFEAPPAASLSPLPIQKSSSVGWSQRARESRTLAEKATDATVKNELMAIAELYDLLEAKEGASAPAGPGARAA